MPFGYYCYNYDGGYSDYYPVDMEDAYNNQAEDELLEDGDEVLSQFTEDAPALRASSDKATNQTVTAKWFGVSNNWKKAPAAPAVAAAAADDEDELVRDETDTSLTDVSETVNWYAINFAASVFNIVAEDGTSRTVGDTSHILYTAKDQNGEPIEGLNVQFFRSGPDDLQDGDGNSRALTDEDGEASYIFQGAKAGKAVIDTVVRFDLDGNDDTLEGDEVPGANTSITVTFSPESAPKVRKTIIAKLELENAAGGKDKATVNAPKAADGARVKIFKIKADGGKVLIAIKRANKYGNAKFVMDDKNGRKFTTYKAKVAQTPATFMDWTPKKRVR
jgi:hypothetical protein